MTILGTSSMMFAQSNTGTTPYEDSYHYYQVNGGTASPGNTYTWEVYQNNKTDKATAAQFVFTDLNGDPLGAPGTPATDQAKVYIKWLEANTGVESYYVSITETNTHCSTNRLLKVTVSDNLFNIEVVLVSTKDECASIINPVSDEGTPNILTDDTFGLTIRKFKLTMTGDATKDWSYTYTLSGAANITNVTIEDGETGTPADLYNGANATGSITSGGDKSVNIITVSFATNPGVEENLQLALTDGKDEIGTLENDITAADNIKTYTVWAVPATTGITTD